MNDELERAYTHAACGLLTVSSVGVIERVNETICAWTGRSAGELVGERFQSLLTMGSKLFHQTHWSPLLQMQGSVAEVQLELKNRDGRVVPVLVNASKRRGMDDGRVEIAVFVAEDRRKYERELLLARKRAEELLERAREAEAARGLAEGQLRLALRSANLRVWSADPVTGVRHYEPGVAALLGRPAFETITAEVYAFHMHPRDQARDAKALREALDPSLRGAYCLEYPLSGSDGVERIVRSTGHAFFDEDGRAIQFSGVIEDITERTRAQEALQQRETEFRTLAENSPDIILRFDRDRRFIYVSPAVGRITGRSADVYLGRALDDLDLEPALLEAWSNALEDAFAGRETTLIRPHVAADGSQLELQSHIVPERNTRGEVVRVLAISRDITLLKQQETQAHQRAVLAEQLIGIVSHDLRNPLSAIALAAHLLSAVDLGSNARIVRRIVSSTDRASRLIADLLDFTQARLGGGLRVTQDNIDLHAVVADTIDEVKMAWAGRMIQHQKVGEGTGSADSDRLAQVVTNLVNNALVYGAADEPVTVISAVKDDRLEICVHNGGPPIPDALKAHMFEPLRRGAHEVQLGSRSVGLGLYIVREIASAHGGAVSLHSTAQDGTRFKVSLPRAAPTRLDCEQHPS